MRKLTKIIAVMILSAIILSVFAGFSVFAEDASAAAAEPTVLYDIDTKAPAIVSTPSENPVIMTTNTAANGVPYYVFKYEKGWSVENDGAYVGVASEGSQIVYLQLAPSRPYFTDGYNSKGAPVQDTVDYLVIDMDISTVTDVFDSLFFQTMFYYRTSAGDRTSGQNGHYTLKDPLSENAAFLCPNDKNTSKSTVAVDQPASDWAHITMVVDVSVDTNRQAYLYYNGKFVNSRRCMKDTADYLDYIRIELSDVGVTPNADNESLAIANATIKSFPKGYSGAIATDKDKLGNTEYTLDAFSDLKYCLEDTPERGIADIVRGDTIIGAMTADDIDCKLQPGDTLNLYGDITDRVIVPGKMEGETLVPDFTVNDNGYTITNPYFIENYGTYDWLLIDADGNITPGAQTYTESGSSASVTTDALYAQIKGGITLDTTENPDASITIVLLKDLYTKFGAEVKINSGSVVVDLNGHTWYDMKTSGYTWYSYGVNKGYTGGKLTVKDGSLVSKGTFLHSHPFAHDTEFNLINLKSASFAKPFILTDGDLNVIDCPKITASGTFVSQFGSTTNVSVVTIENSNIVSGGALSTIASLTRSGYAYSPSGNRCGGMNITFNVDNSTFVTSGEQVFDINLYANKAGKTSAFQQPNYVTLNLNNSELTSTGTAISADIHTINDLDTVAAKYGTLNFIYKVNLTDSEVNAKDFIYVSDSIARDAYGEDVSTMGAATITSTVSVTGGGLNLTDTAIIRNSENSELKVSATVANGVKTNVTTLASEDVTLTTAEGALVAYTSDAKYTYVLTDTYRDFKYSVQNKDGSTVAKSGEFKWNGADDTADKVDASRVFPLPEATTEYKYTDWVLSGDTYVSTLMPAFGLSVNLTALTDFYLNVYLPDGVDTSKITLKVGEDTVSTYDEVSLGEKAYLKAASIKGISPDKVTDASTVTVSVAGAYGEVTTASMPVSVEQYLVKANGTATLSEAGKTFIRAIIDYVVAANNYDGTAPESLKALASETIAAPTYGDVKWEALEGISAGLNLGDSVRWVFTVDEEHRNNQYEISYYRGETLVSGTFTADENGEITIGVKAVDLLKDITITCGESSATVNLAGYHDALGKLENFDPTKAQAVVNAMYYYSVAASAYAPEHK